MFHRGGDVYWFSDPHTAEGREWWEQALKLDVTVTRNSEWMAEYWPARLNQLDMMHLPYQRHIARSRTEAIIAAIEAAALAGAPTPEQQRERSG